MGQGHALHDSPPSQLVALLVDRDDDTRHMYSEYLRRLGAWAVEEAADGRDALAKVFATHPDVVITETRLPGISGYDLCSLLRSDVSTSSIPIVVVTADAFATDLARAQGAGADAVLPKPCLPETLFSEIRRVVDSSRALQPKAAALRVRLGSQLAPSEDVIGRAHATVQQRISLKRAHQRGDTTTPPVSPPSLVCPQCDRTLIYERSHIGGVSTKHSEQWDYFECPAGCGTFQYRTRTRKLRKM